MLVPRRPNSQLKPCNCDCDIPHVDIVATELIAEGAAVIVSEGATVAVEGFSFSLMAVVDVRRALGGQDIVSSAFGQAI